MASSSDQPAVPAGEPPAEQPGESSETLSRSSSIRVDTDTYDDDPAYDSEIASYTTSLASMVTDFKFENGRRYHSYKEGSYLWPNDEKEKDRLDIVHKMVETAMRGKLFYAPLVAPKRVLDLGTGTGIWAMEFADNFPNADVVGNDLSPIQPQWVPPNVTFEVDDIEAEWTFSQPFDFIHSRSMGNSVKDWPRLVQQCHDNLAPGGFVEFVDFDSTWHSPDGSLKPDSVLMTVVNMFIDMGHKAGVEPSAGPKLEKWCKDAGFADVKVARHAIPAGTWPADRHLKEVGAWQYLQIVEGIDGMVIAYFTRMYGMTKEEVEVLCAKFKAELKNPRIHTFLYMYVVTAQKAAARDEDED